MIDTVAAVKWVALLALLLVIVFAVLLARFPEDPE